MCLYREREREKEGKQVSVVVSLSETLMAPYTVSSRTITFSAVGVLFAGYFYYYYCIRVLLFLSTLKGANQRRDELLYPKRDIFSPIFLRLRTINE